MSYLNVSITPSYVVTLEYERVAENFVFKSDINCVNGWRIQSIIRQDSIQSPSVLDTRRYPFLEFVIKDCKGRQRIKRYFFDDYDSQNINENMGVHCKRALSALQAIAYFIENTKIFHYANWEEYDVGGVLEQIKDVMNKDIPQEEMLQRMKALLIK